MKNVNSSRNKSTLNSPLYIQIIWHSIIFLLVAIALLPILWMISTSFKPAHEIFGTGIKILPIEPTLKNFIYLWQNFNITKILGNTLLITVLITTSRLFIGLLAAYGFARYNFPLRKPLFYTCILTMFIPIQVIMLPNYLFISNLGLIDHYMGVVLPQLAHTFPIFLLHQHLKIFPEELIDVARIDGAGELSILFKVVLPCIRPALVAITMIIFINTWNQYVWPAIILRSPTHMTLPIWLRQFMQSEAGLNWGLLMSASFLGVVPVLILYIIAHRQIIQTFISSGIKG